MRTTPNIIKVAELVEALSKDTFTKQEKAQMIIRERNDGVISADDALELALNYCIDEKSAPAPVAQPEFMRFNIDGYAIDIRASHPSFDDQGFEAVTMGFLNKVSIWMDEAAAYESFRHIGDECPNMDREVSIRCGGYLKEHSDSLYEQLKEAGCYNRQ